MATASPPRPPAPTPPPGGQPPTGPPPRARAPRAGRFTRPLALGALLLAVVIVLLLVLGGSGGSTYKIEFAEADQLVRGDQVQVGGVPVGSITNIDLTRDYKALVTIHVNGFKLHEGTIAEVRTPSLSSVANRYISLDLGPNNRPEITPGSILPVTATKSQTDLDQLFNIFNPKTREGLRNVIRGFGEQYAGAGRALGGATEYFPPAIAATDHFFAELVRDQPVFTSFLVETGKALETIGARHEALSELIENANKTFEAIGSEQTNLAHGLRELPRAFRQGNTTFRELPATFSALKELVDASKPTSKPLTTLFQRLHGLVTTATTPVSEFAEAFSKPGTNNDLTDYVRALPSLARALQTATPVAVTSLRESIPITAFWGPYSPDLAGAARAFGQTGSYYDADGHYARLSPVFPDFALEGNTLKPASAQTVIQNLKTGQLRRCPGAATQPAPDGSSPFTDNGLLSCDPTETP
jgi:phospholipid/cholesterol/gamma-HCH transport system substrate-binding protein